MDLRQKRWLVAVMFLAMWGAVVVQGLVDYDDALEALTAEQQQMLQGRFAERAKGRPGLPVEHRQSLYVNPSPEKSNRAVIPAEYVYFAKGPFSNAPPRTDDDILLINPDCPSSHSSPSPSSVASSEVIGHHESDSTFHFTTNSSTCEQEVLEVRVEDEYLRSRFVLWNGQLLFLSDNFTRWHNCSVVLSMVGGERVISLEENVNQQQRLLLLGRAVGKFKVFDSINILLSDQAPERYTTVDGQERHGFALSALQFRRRLRADELQEPPSNRKKKGGFGSQRARLESTPARQHLSAPLRYSPDVQSLMVAADSATLFQMERFILAIAWPVYRHHRFDDEIPQAILADQAYFLSSFSSEQGGAPAMTEEYSYEYQHKLAQASQPPLASFLNGSSARTAEGKAAPYSIVYPGWMARVAPSQQNSQWRDPISFAWEIEGSHQDILQFYRPEILSDLEWSSLDGHMKSFLLNCATYNGTFQSTISPECGPAQLKTVFRYDHLVQLANRTMHWLTSEQCFGWYSFVKCRRPGFCCNDEDAHICQRTRACATRTSMHKWLPERLQNELYGTAWEMVEDSFIEEFDEMHARISCLCLLLDTAPSLHFHVVFQPPPTALWVKSLVSSALLWSDLFFLRANFELSFHNFAFAAPSREMLDELVMQLEHGFIAQETTMRGANWGSLKQQGIGLRHGPYGPGKIAYELRLGTAGGSHLYRGHSTFHPELNWTDISTSAIMAMVADDFSDPHQLEEADRPQIVEEEEAIAAQQDDQEPPQGASIAADDDEEEDKEDKQIKARQLNRLEKQRKCRAEEVSAYQESAERIHFYSLLADNMRLMVASPLGLLTPVHLNLEPGNLFNHSVVTTYLNWRQYRSASDCQIYSQCPFRLSAYMVQLPSSSSSTPQTQPPAEEEKGAENDGEENASAAATGEQEPGAALTQLPDTIDEQWIEGQLVRRFAECSRQMADTTVPWASTSARLRDLSLICMSDFFAAKGGTAQGYRPLLNETERSYLRGQVQLVCQQLRWFLHGFAANTTAVTASQLLEPINCIQRHRDLGKLLRTVLTVPPEFIELGKKVSSDDDHQDVDLVATSSTSSPSSSTSPSSSESGDDKVPRNPRLAQLQAEQAERTAQRNRMILFLEWNIELT